MRTLFSNRYIDAFAKMVMLSGITHLIILACVAIRDDIYVLNTFNIVSLNLLIPGLEQGLPNFIISYGVILVVYGLIFTFLTNPAKNDEP
jgi:hypothetical protein